MKRFKIQSGISEGGAAETAKLSIDPQTGRFMLSYILLGLRRQRSIGTENRAFAEQVQNVTEYVVDLVNQGVCPPSYMIEILPDDVRRDVESALKLKTAKSS